MVIDAAARCGNLTAAEQWFRRAQAGAKAEGRTVVGALEEAMLDGWGCFAQ